MAYDRDGPPVEVICRNDNLGLAGQNALHRFAPLARGLQRGLDGLRARVHRQYHLVAGERVQLLAQQRQLVVAKGPRGDRYLRGLLAQRAIDRRVAVPLVHRRVCREQIQVLSALHVIHPRARGTLDHNIQGMVVVGAKTIF
jgi:hypothetical protein